MTQGLAMDVKLLNFKKLKLINIIKGAYLPFELQPPASTLASSVRNIHCPGRATFEVEESLRMSFVLEPGITKNLTPSPALKPPYREKLAF